MINDQVATDLKIDEGWNPSLYRDSLGYWTIGFGFCVDPATHAELPRDVGEYWLNVLVGNCIQDVNQALPWVASQPTDVKRALYNMAYQLGVDGLLAFKRMLASLQAGDRHTAATEALNSHWAQQTPRRAQRMAALIGGAE